VLATAGENIYADGGCPAGQPGDLIYEGDPAALVDPALRDNGGPTMTHALPAGSQAIDHVPPDRCAGPDDQRGVARPAGAGCDVGAVEVSTSLTVWTTGNGAVLVAPPGTATTGGEYAFAPGKVITLTPQPDPGQTFVGWIVDGVYRGWAAPFNLTMDADHTVQATFAPTVTFPDVGGGRADYAAIVALATRGTIRGYANGTYGPDDGVQRAQMAALIARAMPAGPGTPPATLTPPACLAGGTWDCEDWGNDFTDRGGLDGNLWRNVGTLQHYQVAFGYDGAACADRGVPSPCYGPTEAVSYAQTIAFITRAMIAKGYWVAQPNAPLPDPGIPGVLATEAKTFAFYTGGVPALPGGEGWNDGASRGWFARALWAALDAYWGN
jgi:hypothetical protein